jgi:uncharacterized membrane protein
METQQNQNVSGESPNPGPQPTPQVTTDNTTLMGVLAYLGPFVVIPFLIAKHDPFVKFHVKQGLVLVVLEILVMVLNSMLWGLGMILSIVNFGLIVLSIVGIVNVINKKQQEVPLVGQFAQHVNI